MPKEIFVIDLLSKLSANSFLVQTQEERLHITPGIFFGMPDKFFRYSDVLDIALKLATLGKEGVLVVDIEAFKENIAPKALDMNEFFKVLQSTIKNKDVLGLNETTEPAQPAQQTPAQPTNKETVQPTQQTSAQSNGTEAKMESENIPKRSTNSKPQNYSKKTYNGYRKTYSTKNGYVKRTYKNTSKKSGTK